MIKGIHYAVIPNSNDNAGDNLLYSAMRFLITKYSRHSIYWKIDSQWYPSSAACVNQSDSDFALFGGGGLFLPDQKGANYSNNTGWQINIPACDYNKITIPYFFASVGYNWFRNSPIDPSIIADSAYSCIQHSSVFGMRNHGSIDKINTIVSPDKSITWLPCPTTLLSSIRYLPQEDSHISYVLKSHFNLPSSRIGLNLSCDRLSQRLIDARDFGKLRLSLSYLRDMGAELIYIAHKQDDLFAYNNIGSSYFDGCIVFSELDVKTLIEMYMSFDAVMGGRGHSLMIPVGLNIPIVSITSHDKQKFFMQDCLPSKYDIELSSLPEDQILARIKDCFSTLNEQYSFLHDYHEKGFAAWSSFIGEFDSYF